MRHDCAVSAENITLLILTRYSEAACEFVRDVGFCLRPVLQCDTDRHRISRIHITQLQAHINTCIKFFHTGLSRHSDKHTD